MQSFNFVEIITLITVGDFCNMSKITQRWTYENQTCASMLLMTCEFQQYQYCKECNLCSDDTAKMAIYDYCLPSELLSITLVYI